MTKLEHLLVCLNEECLEVGKAVTKALRFGLEDKHSTSTNRQDIIQEITELYGVIELLEEEGLNLEAIGDRMFINMKKEKVKKYMKYAEDRGMIK